MSLNALLASWRSAPDIGGNVAAWRTLPARDAEWAPLPPDLHPALRAALAARGFAQLYSHQAAAWQHARAGQHVALVTGTASGKTLAYNLPVLHGLLEAPDARALYIFPTKALAQDQHDELDKLLADLPAGQRVPVGVYDGDTPQSARGKVRANARLLISNPDMLHQGILPHHTRWVEFFSNLRYVVIDEMHTYRGVFGSHVANVLRRLKRICQFYGASPQFVLTSATIANPHELVRWLIEAPVHVVDSDGAPRGPKHFLIYNPPIVNEDLGIRRSVTQESVRLAGELLRDGVQTIVFGRSRNAVEVMLNYLREAAGMSAEQVRGYRSGYLARQRREIEAGLRAGTVRGVVATTALELGIDIGGMDAAVLAGYPGTIAGTWQQAGRAGRALEPSLATLVASATPLDQFLAQHPDFFFESTPEQALVNPDNLLILLGHLRSAAFELPFHVGEGFGGVDGDTVAEYLTALSEAGELHRSGEKYFWMADKYPAAAISLRSASPNTIVLHVHTEDGPRIIGEVDSASASWLVHPEAIYIHEGQSYVVEELNLDEYTASLRPASVDYYTQATRDTTVNLLGTYAHNEVRGGLKSHGELSIVSQVIGYQRIEWHSHARLGSGTLEMPPAELQTTGYWVTIGDDTVAALRAQGLWNSDPNDYGPNWQQQRKAALERDGNACQVCGRQIAGLHVHHRTPFRAFASAEEANQLDNLISLCPVCHHLAENVVRVRSGLGGLAYTLEHIAPLFLMTAPGDLGMHHDFVLDLADGKPAIVIYDAVPAGIGFSERLYELHDELMLRAWEVVAACGCTDGCPSCVGPGGEAGQGSKKETLALLELLKLDR